MDRHDAKPRRPSLMAGAEAQRPASGQPPARILTDVEQRPAARQPRRSTHVRAALVAGMGLLAIATLGWALLASDGDVTFVEAAAASAAVVEDAPSAPSTATLVEEAPRPSTTATADNPFESGTRAVLADSADRDADPVAATLAAAANAAAASTANANPFSAMEAPPRATGAGRTAASASAPVAPQPTATARIPAAPAARTASVPPAKEAGLLQTLMENIQQPAEPARDTRAMDRLAKRLDRAPMTASAPAARPPAEAPASVKPAPLSPAAVRAELDRCPTGNNLRADWCRRRVCKRAGLDPWACGQR